jgi:thymidylate synthase (FAD)|tara:strand:+ start:1000 stop:1869 length:870 start_codon:yes stop_codon:yes gene_type:complete
MTLCSEIDFNKDPNYKQVLDKGFIGLVDYMGTDNSIVQAARVSYGDGTKKASSDRALIRYLMRHEHTTPFEMCEVKFHIKLPIFVMRQLVRHRTASLNEYSARYSVLTDEVYVPNSENIKPQSTTNKQGREGELDEETKRRISDDINESWDRDYSLYTEHSDNLNLARETARQVLPVGGYTECYWKSNLKNFLHYARLRMDSHAQWEIQEYARAMYDMVKEKFPVACEAFEDYQEQSVKLSKQELVFVKSLMFREIDINRIDEIGENFGISKREMQEIVEKFGLNDIQN